MTIIFKTPGTLDMTQVTSFGTSVKAEGAIGFFGTGLKYALAILMRTGHKVSIHTDGKTYLFDLIVTLGERLTGEPL